MTERTDGEGKKRPDDECEMMGKRNGRNVHREVLGHSTTMTLIQYVPPVQDLRGGAVCLSRYPISFVAGGPVDSVSDLLEELRGKPFVPRDPRDFYLQIRFGNEWVDEQHVLDISAGPREMVHVRIVSLQRYLGDTEEVEIIPHPCRSPGPARCCPSCCTGCTCVVM